MTIEERIMTTEERIAGLEETADFHRKRTSHGGPLVAIALELRALRLMLREEIREAAWRLAEGNVVYSESVPLGARKPSTVFDDPQHPFRVDPEPLASRKAPPLEDKP